MRDIELSIIIPIYNGIAFIEDCTDSVVKSLLPNQECIIVDDGSIEDTKSILSKYEDNKNVRVFYRPHKGPSGARNYGISVAKGKYIGFKDGDDFIGEDFLTKSQKLTEEDADLYIFGIENRFVNKKENTDYEVWGIDEHFYSSVSEYADRYIREHNLLIYSSCNKFYKKEIIDRFNVSFDENVEFGEDRLFNYSYLKCCKNIRTSNLIMCIYLDQGNEHLSTREISGFEELMYMLHEKKIECFQSLSQNASKEEIEAFIKFDLEKTKMALNR